ncbi:MAG: YceI family protein [Balneolaceae bacterium]
MKRLLPILFLVGLASSAFSQSFYTETGTAVFYSKVPLHSFSGTSENLVGLINLDESTIDFYLDLETLNTGNGKRDKDMLLTLDVKKYPFGEFFGKMTSEFDVDLQQEQDVTVEGVFKIHGKEQNVVISGTLTPEGNTLKLTAGWILKLEDYEIEPPSLLFIKVDQEQEIEINAVLTIKE